LGKRIALSTNRQFIEFIERSRAGSECKKTYADAAAASSDGAAREFDPEDRFAPRATLGAHKPPAPFGRNASAEETCRWVGGNRGPTGHSA